MLITYLNPTYLWCFSPDPQIDHLKSDLQKSQISIVSGFQIPNVHNGHILILSQSEHQTSPVFKSGIFAHACLKSGAIAEQSILCVCICSRFVVGVPGSNPTWGCFFQVGW